MCSLDEDNDSDWTPEDRPAARSIRAETTRRVKGHLPAGVAVAYDRWPFSEE